MHPLAASTSSPCDMTILCLFASTPSLPSTVSSPRRPFPSHFEYISPIQRKQIPSYWTWVQALSLFTHSSKAFLLAVFEVMAHKCLIVSHPILLAVDALERSIIPPPPPVAQGWKAYCTFDSPKSWRSSCSSYFSPCRPRYGARKYYLTAPRPI